jgi:hypothetical protein
MKTKHTEGKWTYGSNGTFFEINPQIANLSTFRDFEEQEANARLIAAAPELLKSLEYAVKFIKLCPKLTEEDQPRGLEKWEEIIKKTTE